MVPTIEEPESATTNEQTGPKKKKGDVANIPKMCKPSSPRVVSLLSTEGATGHHAAYRSIFNLTNYLCIAGRVMSSHMSFYFRAQNEYTPLNIVIPVCYAKFCFLDSSIDYCRVSGIIARHRGN